MHLKDEDSSVRAQKDPERMIKISVKKKHSHKLCILDHLHQNCTRLFILFDTVRLCCYRDPDPQCKVESDKGIVKVTDPTQLSLRETETVFREIVRR